MELATIKLSLGTAGNADMACVRLRLSNGGKDTADDVAVIPQVVRGVPVQLNLAHEGALRLLPRRMGTV
jgi:hypothetical protein